MCVMQPKLWPGLYKNKESVGDLWLGLLRFYTEEFLFGQHVICIRRLAPLTKFEKLWNGYGIAIEDPFDLSHNLGSGLSRKSGCMFPSLSSISRSLLCYLNRSRTNYSVAFIYLFGLLWCDVYMTVQHKELLITKFASHTHGGYCCGSITVFECSWHSLSS